MKEKKYFYEHGFHASRSSLHCRLLCLCQESKSYSFCKGPFLGLLCCRGKYIFMSINLHIPSRLHLLLVGLNEGTRSHTRRGYIYKCYSIYWSDTHEVDLQFSSEGDAKVSRKEFSHRHKERNCHSKGNLWKLKFLPQV